MLRPATAHLWTSWAAGRRMAVVLLRRLAGCTVVGAAVLIAGCGHYDNELPKRSSSVCAYTEPAPGETTVATRVECNDVTHVSP